MAWNPADHPRGADGRFIPKDSGSIAGVLLGLLVVFGLIGGGLSQLTDSASATSGPPETWKSLGLEFTTQNHDNPGKCGDIYSYGDVQTFMSEHPCSALERGLFEATGAAGNTMTVATATVTMASAQQAEQLRALVDRPGTGNIRELAPGFSGNHYASHVDGNTVTIAQAEPKLLEQAPAAALDRAARAALAVPQG